MNWHCRSQAEQDEFVAKVLDRLYELEVTIPEQQEDFFLWRDDTFWPGYTMRPPQPPPEPSPRKPGRQKSDKRDYSELEWHWFRDVSQTLKRIEWIFKNDLGITYRSERNPPTKWDILQTYYGPGLNMRRFRSFNKEWRSLKPRIS